MPNTRENLVELLNDALRSVDWNSNDYPDTEKATDILIANGVTIATDNNVGHKWIPVTERLPEANGYYLCLVCVSAVNQRKEYRRMILFWEDNLWIDMANCFRTKKPLYWMPLPEPPKGE